MDLATLVGLLGAFGIIIAAIVVGGSAIIFVNPPSLLIVVGGTLFAVLMKFPMGHFFSAFKVAAKAFFNKPEDAVKLIEEGVELANIARKEGVLGLEGRDIDNEFLQRGIQLSVDGHEPEFVRAMLGKDINLTIDRHERGQAIFKAIGDVAPAMGMIGTLIGLVQMLGSLDDPTTIGPSMAVALLTTFYGAVIANVMCIPVAGKLRLRSQSEVLLKTLITEGMDSIMAGENPRLMEQKLHAFIPPNQRNSVYDK